MSAVPQIRRRTLVEGAPRTDGDYVLYWMIATRRLGWSFALDRALELARELNRPLLILEPLRVDHGWASDRHHRMVIDGMAHHRAALADTGVGYHAYVEPRRGAGKGLLAALAERASFVVTDDAPVFFLPRMVRAASAAVRVPLEAVDGCGLLPLRATDRSHSSAHHFRRFLHKTLPEHLAVRPMPDPLAGLSIPRLERVPAEIVERWPSADRVLAEEAFWSGDPTGRDASADLDLGPLPIDHTVAPTAVRGGHGAARRRLEAFLREALDRYGEERNHPDADATSRLSPWLHYGHISAHEVFDAVARREGWTPQRISPPHDGRRRGWWGMSESAEAFLDELVTWRELGYGFCYHEADYARYESLPEWARETLEAHAGDERPWVYSLGELEAATTHDEIWNAAQRQLRHEGLIHGYLRMLWGKKILEWSEHPRDALRAMTELNNRYALDGRDPNSHSGITWVMGRFDRGWPEREIYGKVRSMTSRSTRRKVRLDRYLERWAEGEAGR